MFSLVHRSIICMLGLRYIYLSSSSIAFFIRAYKCRYRVFNINIAEYKGNSFRLNIIAELLFQESQHSQY